MGPSNGPVHHCVLGWPHLGGSWGADIAHTGPTCHTELAQGPGRCLNLSWSLTHQSRRLPKTLFGEHVAIWRESPRGQSTQGGSPQSVDWLVGCGLWDVGCGLWAVACGPWTVACGLWTVGCGQWPMGCGVWAVALDKLLHIPIVTTHGDEEYPWR